MVLVMEVLCDTVCLWALYFRDSAYRSHVLELRRGNVLVIPVTSIIEAFYPIVKAKGVVELARYSLFVENLVYAPRIRVVNVTTRDLALAGKLLVEYEEYFRGSRGEIYLFDAILCAIWLNNKGLILATSDENIIRFARKLGLHDKLIVLEKKSK